MAKAAALKTHINDWQPYLILIIGTLAGSTGPIFIRLAQNAGVPSPVITALRFIIATLFFTPFVWNRYRDELRHLNRRDVLVVLAAGGIFALQLTANFESFRFTSILITGVIIGSVPLWTALIERFWLHTQLSQEVWIGLACALVGGAFIALSGDAEASGTRPLLGALLALVGAILGAIYLNVGRVLRSRISFLPFVWLVFASGSLATLVILLLGGYSLTNYSTEGYTWVLMATLLPQMVAHGSFNYALAYLPATMVSMSGQLVTVISAIAAYFAFAELPATLQIVGSGIIVGGVILAIRGTTNRKD